MVLIFQATTVQSIGDSTLLRKPEILGLLLALMWTCALVANNFCVQALSPLDGKNNAVAIILDLLLEQLKS